MKFILESTFLKNFKIPRETPEAKGVHSLRSAGRFCKIGEELTVGDEIRLELNRFDLLFPGRESAKQISH